MSTAEPETVIGQTVTGGTSFAEPNLERNGPAMRETKDITLDCRPGERPGEESEVTHPIRIVCCRKGAPSNSRVSRLNKMKESAPRTPDWTEIGEPAG